MPLPHAPAPRPGEQQLKNLADRVFILPDDPLAQFTGWRRRIAGFVWRFLGPSLQRQQEFNGAVAEIVTGNVGGDLAAFIDAKDREVQRVLGDALSSLADELAKRWESMVAREQRYQARVAEQASGLADVRASLAAVQQLAHAMKREMEQRPATIGAPGAAVSAPRGAANATPPLVQSDDRSAGAQHATVAPAATQSDVLLSTRYVGFEDHFRGSADQVRASLADYVGIFEEASDVLDVGCGRGEFLELLAASGIRARGVDANHEMAATCRDRGLDVAEGDAVDYLRALPDQSLGGLFASQVMEHLDPDRLLRLLDVAFSKLRPGSPIVIETINPACWAAFFDSYIRDLTHVRPVHPDTLQYLLRATGFQHVDIRYRAPYPEQSKLQTVAMPVPAPDGPAVDWAVRDLGDTLNANIEKLNARLFTYLDYAVVALRP